jgi:lysophospholipase L1-like esterase
MSVVVTQAPALTATRFLAFGDSVTAGEVTAPVSGAPVMGLVVVPSASYPSRLQERLRSRYTSQASEVSVVNAGRSSELAHEGVPRLADLLANSQTQALLLLHGYSDVLDFGANGVSRAIGAMNDMARQGRLRGARVFVGLLTPSIPGRQRSVPDSVIRDYNDRLSSMIAGEGALRVNLYGALASDVNRYIGVDGLHPTEAGYQRIAEEFLSAIGAELEPR